MYNTDAPEWITNVERTEYSDAIFSKIGRLLFKATRFESYCKTASSIILMKSDLKILDDDEIFNEFLIQVERKWLNEHITTIKTALTFSEIKGYFTTAKNSRNSVAHGLTLGLEHVFGITKNEKDLERTIAKLTKDIVTGEYYAILLSCVLTHELFPSPKYIQDNIDWVLAD